jgi:hypothetical protein
LPGTRKNAAGMFIETKRDSWVLLSQQIPGFQEEIRGSEIPRFESKRKVGACKRSRPWHTGVDLRSYLEGIDTESANDGAGRLAASDYKTREALLRESACDVRQESLDKLACIHSTKLGLNLLYFIRIGRRIDEDRPG